MESEGNKTMQQRLEDQKHEIESFVVRIYRHNLIKDGGIIKRKLREKLLEEIKLRRITRIKVQELGFVLMSHDLLTRTGKRLDDQQSMFKFNMTRVRELLEKDEQKLHAELLSDNTKNKGLPRDKRISPIQLVDKKGPLAEITHVTTVERMFKYNHQPSLSSCFVCQKYNFRADVDYRRHFDKVHGNQFTIPESSCQFKTDQKLEILQHYDPLNPITRFTIHNIYSTAMQIECVYLYHSTHQLMPVNRGLWPITINSGDSFKFSITSEMFLIEKFNYTILVHFSRILEYVEQYHFRVLKKPVKLGVHSKPIRLRKLKNYYPPPAMLKVLKNGFKMSDDYTLEEKTICQDICNYNDTKHLDANNYVKVLLLMNNIEDCNVQYELSRYESNNVQFKIDKTKCIYSMPLKQPTQSSPPLVEGDFIELSVALTNKPVKIAATISQICSDKILFEAERPLKLDIRYRVKFKPNRTTIQMEYQALEIVQQNRLAKFFFPVKPPTKCPDFSREDFAWFNKNIQSNEEQLTAVINIVNQTARPAPFILFGPPGTGKTSTLVEAIAQIVKMKPDDHVLVTATSNYACNELTMRLLQVVPKDTIFRFFSRQADMADMSYELINVSNLNTGAYRLPNVEEIYYKRIIVSTLTCAGRLVQASIKPGHFQYVFIDECGSATEASALIPVAGVITGSGKINGSIILAGDPKQLGPVTRSQYAANMGLNVSMLERLMNLDLYQKDPETKEYNSCLISKLLKNFRSHEAILTFSNIMFYDNELKACAPKEVVEWAFNWKELPSNGFPIIFESSMGKLARERDSASYFNEKEIKLVEFYIRILLTRGVNGRLVEQEDIGVISPYKKQCLKVKQMCQRHGWNQVEIGSVEAFQGREKHIMILTTVRSGTSGVGFLNNVKRLNVALTRAKALLIVIGNPETLQKDPNWYQFVRYCYHANAVRGVKFVLDEEKRQVQGKTANGFLKICQDQIDLIIEKINGLRV